MVVRLPVVKYGGVEWFFDERLKELRTVKPPLEFMRLNDFEVEYFKEKVLNRRCV